MHETIFHWILRAGEIPRRKNLSPCTWRRTPWQSSGWALHQVFGTSACQQQAGPFRIPAIGITVERRTDTIACDQGTEGHHAVRALIGKVLLCQRPELVLADVWIEPELCHGVRLHVQGDKFFLLAHWSKPWFPELQSYLFFSCFDPNTQLFLI